MRESCEFRGEKEGGILYSRQRPKVKKIGNEHWTKTTCRGQKSVCVRVRLCHAQPKAAALYPIGRLFKDIFSLSLPLISSCGGE